MTGTYKGISTAKEYVSKASQLWFGMLYYANYHNTIVDIAKALITPVNVLIPGSDYELYVNKLKYRRDGDIVDPDDHNNVVYALKSLVDYVSTYYPDLDKEFGFSDSVNKLRIVSVGDDILADDYNDKLNALKSLADLLEYVYNNVLVCVAGIHRIRDYRIEYEPDYVIVDFGRHANIPSYLCKLDKNGNALVIVEAPNLSEFDNEGVLIHPHGRVITVHYGSPTYGTLGVYLSIYDTGLNLIADVYVQDFDTEPASFNPCIDEYGHILMPGDDTLYCIDKDGNVIGTFKLPTGISFNLNAVPIGTVSVSPSYDYANRGGINVTYDNIAVAEAYKPGYSVILAFNVLPNGYITLLWTYEDTYYSGSLKIPTFNPNTGYVYCPAYIHAWIFDPKNYASPLRVNISSKGIVSGTVTYIPLLTEASVNDKGNFIIGVQSEGYTSTNFVFQGDGAFYYVEFDKQGYPSSQQYFLSNVSYNGNVVTQGCLGNSIPPVYIPTAYSYFLPISIMGLDSSGYVVWETWGLLPSYGAIAPLHPYASQINFYPGGRALLITSKSIYLGDTVLCKLDLSKIPITGIYTGYEWYFTPNPTYAIYSWASCVVPLNVK